MAKATLAVIYGNHDFFLDSLITQARNDIKKLFTELDIEAVALDENASKPGAVETWEDTLGMLRAYVGEGEFTEDPLETFGARAVVKIPELQDLLKYICMNGFEHHVAMNVSKTAHIIAEAFDNYLKWDVYYYLG